MSIATPYPYSYMSKRLVEDLGIDVTKNAEMTSRELFDTYHLGPSTFFDKEHFGEDRLVVGTGRLPWDQFFGKAPLSEAARKDLIRLHGENPDYMAGMSVEHKMATLAKISYQEFLLKHAKMSPDALPFFLGQGGRNNKRVDTTPALEAARRGSSASTGWGCRRRSSSGRAATRSTSRTAMPPSPGCWCRAWCRRPFPGRTTCTPSASRWWTTAGWTMTRRRFGSA